MSYATKNKKNVFGSIVGVFVVAAIAIWQFYLFVTFEVAGSDLSGQNGTHHLWWAIALAVLACGAAFLVFSVFLRHDSDDDLHITSAPRARI
jgi:H+/Cl- antiporter ClcA